jgi:hypothetical protein
MHHYASFTGQHSGNLPWSGVFGEPSLVISAEADVQTFTHSGSSYGGWGYVCPVLEDTEPSFHGVIEYCVEEWRSSNDASSWKGEGFGECGGSSAIIHSLFYSGTQYVTEMAGSANSTESAGNAHYEAKITKTNLINAVKLVKSNCAGWHLSENPANYSLIGVEQGLEGWHGLTELAGSTGNLQLRTEYTPLPPAATTNTASGIQEEETTMNGTVNPNGTATHYYFQYGETTAYGASTSEGNAGSGQSSVPESATITGLQPGMAYHYRIVATSPGGTTYGSDSTFTTNSNPSLIVDQSNNRRVTFEGANHTLDIMEQFQSNGEWGGLEQVAGPGTTYSAPSLIIDKNNNRWVAFEGANHTLDIMEQFHATGGWGGLEQIAGPGTTYSAPSLIIDKNDYRWVSAEGANNSLFVKQQFESEGVWQWGGLETIAGAGTTYSAPSLVIDHENDRWVSAEGANHTLNIMEQFQSNGKWGGLEQVAGTGTTYSAPSLIDDQDDSRWVAARGASNSLFVKHEFEFEGVWQWGGLETIAGAGTTYSAPSLIIDQGNDRWVSADGASNSLFVKEQFQANGEWGGLQTIAGAGTTG